jgi:hypothetical protein
LGPAISIILSFFYIGHEEAFLLFLAEFLIQFSMMIIFFCSYSLIGLKIWFKLLLCFLGLISDFQSSYYIIKGRNGYNNPANECMNLLKKTVWFIAALASLLIFSSKSTCPIPYCEHEKYCITTNGND